MLKHNTKKVNKSAKKINSSATKNTNSKVVSKKKINKEPKNLFTLIQLFFEEIIILIRSVGMGVFGVFDFLLSFIVSFVSYFLWGIFNIFKWLWKFGLSFFIMEVYRMFVGAIEGVQYIINVCIIEFVQLIFNKISKRIYDVYLTIKKKFNEFKQKTASGKSISKSISEYIKNKYENLSFVKEARAREEAKLVILTINQDGADAVRSDVKNTYRYKARDKEGKLITAYFAAFSKLDVYSYLIDAGMIVYEITTSWAINFFHGESSGLKRKIKNKDLIFWLAQLSTYIKAGIPLTEAVKILAKQDKRKKYRGVYDSIIYELTMGESFSEALKKQGNVYPPLLVNMIRSAELIGDIEGTLDEMSEYYQEIEDTRKDIIGAITYPIIILVFAGVVVTFMLVYIVPKFVEVYESMDAPLNPVTIVTLNISAFLKENYSTIILVAIAVIIAFRYTYKNLKAFRATVQYLLMHLPVIGNIIIDKEMSLFSRTFATLNKNNILITSSIDILRKITNNEIYRTIMLNTISNLLKGEKMSESFKDHWAIPEIAYYMILTGESTGELAAMLDRVADFYQKQQKNAIKLIKTFIEPILIALLAVVVGLVVLSIIIPMFGIYSSIS